MKKIPIGVRISEEDAEFLNLLEINGARTPSDKLRAIIEEARLRREYSHDFTGAYRMIQEQLTPAIEVMKRVEFENNIHSSQLTRILEWLPEFYAFCLSALSPEKAESPDELQDFEQGAVEKLIRLFESLLHLELSSQKTSYNPDVLFKHLQSLEATMKIVQTASQNKERES